MVRSPDATYSLISSRFGPGQTPSIGIDIRQAPLAGGFLSDDWDFRWNDFDGNVRVVSFLGKSHEGVAGLAGPAPDRHRYIPGRTRSDAPGRCRCPIGMRVFRLAFAGAGIAGAGRGTCFFQQSQRLRTPSEILASQIGHLHRPGASDRVLPGIYRCLSGAGPARPATPSWAIGDPRKLTTVSFPSKSFHRKSQSSETNPPARADCRMSIPMDGV